VVYRFPTEVVRRRARARIEIRRRRFALASVGLSVVIATLVGSGPGGIAPAATPQAPTAVLVRPGDTLWEIAERYAPKEIDPRAYLDVLVRANGSPTVIPGQKIRLP
jgi:Tfp pilus assembly protein FimV